MLSVKYFAPFHWLICLPKGWIPDSNWPLKKRRFSTSTLPTNMHIRRHTNKYRDVTAVSDIFTDHELWCYVSYPMYLIQFETPLSHNTIKHRRFSCINHNISVGPQVSPQFRCLGIKLRNSSARNTTDWTHSQMRERKIQGWNEKLQVMNTNRRLILLRK